MHPVGPLNPKVYWVRRVSIVVLAVAVLIGMVWFLASRTSRSSAGQDAAAAVANTSAAPTLTGVLAASSGASRSSVPSPSPSPTVPTASSGAVSGGPAASGSPVATDPAAVAAVAASSAEAAAQAAAAATAVPAPAAPDPVVPATDAAPPAAVEPPVQAPAPVPSFDAQGKLICPAAAVTVTAITAAPGFVSGSQPTLGMVITNTGTVACQQDVSGTLQVFTVTAADGSRVWSTTDCFPGEGTEVRELTPGQTVQYTIKWSGTSSAPGCAGDRAVVPAGDYTVVAQLGGLTSPPAAFVITG